MASDDEDVLLNVPAAGSAVRPQITLSRPASPSDGDGGETARPGPSASSSVRASFSTIVARLRTVTATSEKSDVNSSTVSHGERVQSLVRRFAVRVRPGWHKLEGSTLSTSDESDTVSAVTVKEFEEQRLREKLKTYCGLDGKMNAPAEEISWQPKAWRKMFIEAINPLGVGYFYWLCIVAMAFIYNAVMIFARAAFDEVIQTTTMMPVWFTLDYFCDMLYILDVALVQIRLGFMDDSGILETDVKKLRTRYCQRKIFIIDLVCLLPLELFYIMPKMRFQALLRLPRLLKVRHLLTFLDRMENRASYPNFFRASKTYLLMVYIVHLTACTYYVISFWEGIGSNKWVYNGEGNGYVRCLFWAVITICSIGGSHVPWPENNFEYLFHGFCFLFGVFVLSTVIGQIRGAIENVNAKKTAYKRRMAMLDKYMQRNEVDHKLQNRVRRWFSYSWDHKQTDEIDACLEHVPTNIKASLAIGAHLEALSKISLFRDCEEMLRQELVVKLKPVWYLPGDYICRKGDVGKEMYILSKGQVQVKIEDEAGTEETVAVLHQGSVFGEISLLSIHDNNRRTAHVVSRWFSQLFVLRKRDLHDVLVDYPEAAETLRKKAIQLLKNDRKRIEMKDNDHDQQKLKKFSKAFAQLHTRAKKRLMKANKVHPAPPEGHSKSPIRAQATLTVIRPQPFRSRPSTARLGIPPNSHTRASSRAQSAVASLRGHSPTPYHLQRPDSRSSRLSVPNPRRQASRSDSQSSLGSYLSVANQQGGGGGSVASTSWVSEAATIGTVGESMAQETTPLPAFHVEIAAEEADPEEPPTEGEKSGLTVDVGGMPHLRPRTAADYDAMSMISRLVDQGVQVKSGTKQKMMVPQMTARSVTPLIQLDSAFDDDDDDEESLGEAPAFSIEVPVQPEPRSISRLIQMRPPALEVDEEDSSSNSTSMDRLSCDGQSPEPGLHVDFGGTTHLRPKTAADYDAMSAISCMLDMGAFDNSGTT